MCKKIHNISLFGQKNNVSASSTSAFNAIFYRLSSTIQLWNYLNCP